MDKIEIAEKYHIENEAKPFEKDPAKLHFPWLSIFCFLLLLGLLAINSIEENKSFYQLPDYLFSLYALLGYLIVLGAVVIWDLRRFYKKRKRFLSRITFLQQQLDQVWESKKKQQQRANLKADHADKLKYFISEKLLESIEYDEKYLHFKSIAAEVRHNGVISYDKITTALKAALSQPELENSKKARYQSALDSARYLWDLLDLSTAENIALHIGDLLIESEEHFYQIHLDQEQKFAMTQSIPLIPTFSPQLPLCRTLDIVDDHEKIRERIFHAKQDENLWQSSFDFDNEHFSVHLENASELLGNPNHITLMLENIIKNAQFFQQKVPYKQHVDRINIVLVEGSDYVKYCIYNRGPWIKSEPIENIFKLGFTTRRNKKHHGNGLGLYFVNEIVKGYDGKIIVKNVRNESRNYTLKICFSNGEEELIQLHCQWQDKRMKVMQTDVNEAGDPETFKGENQWQFNSKKQIQSFELISKNGDATVSELIMKDQELQWCDQKNALYPEWLISVSTSKRKHQLQFQPLDINGVCFEIMLPTAHSRLEDREVSFE